MMAGVQMALVATGYLVYDLTGSASRLGLVTSAQALAMVLLSPIGGVVADRFERKRIIQMGQLVAGILGILVAVLITTDTVTWTHLLIMSAVFGVVFSFTMPARTSMIPLLVRRDQITNAMALNGAILSITFLVAPAIAGVMYAFIGPASVFYTIGALGFIAVLFTTFLPYRPGGGNKAHHTVFEDLKEGLLYVGKHRLLRQILFWTQLSTLLSMSFRYIAPVLVVDVYRLEADALGLLISTMGLGSILGSLLIASGDNRKRGLILILAGIPTAAALIVVAAIPIYMVAVIIMTLMGLGEVMRRALTQALMVEQSGEHYRGRVMSIYLMTFGFVPLAVYPAGIAIEYFGTLPIIGAMGIGTLLVTLAFWATGKRLREFQ